MSNSEKVGRMYEAFGRGDIPAILSQFDENVDWDYGLMDAGVPWLKPAKGIAAVAKFFESLSALEFKKFQPKTILENGNIVVGLIDISLVVKATGKPIHEDDEIHIFHFNDEGKVIRFTHKVDSYQHWAAFTGK